MKRLLAPAIAVLLIILTSIFAFEMLESEDRENPISIVSPTPSPTNVTTNTGGRYVSKIKSDDGLQSAISQGEDADFVSGGDASTNNLSDPRKTVNQTNEGR